MDMSLSGGSPHSSLDVGFSGGSPRIYAGEERFSAPIQAPFFDLRFSAGLSLKPRNKMQQDNAFYAASERRIEYLTIAIGALATIAATAIWNWRAGAAVASGAALSWLNYRWLKQGVSTLARLSTAQARNRKSARPAQRLLEVPRPLRFAHRCRLCYSARLQIAGRKSAGWIICRHRSGPRGIDRPAFPVRARAARRRLA